MNIKVRDLYAANTALQRIAAQPIPAAAAFKIGRIIRKIADPLTDAEHQRNKLLQKYGQVPGQPFVVPQEKMEDFLAEFNPVLDSVVEIDVNPVSEELFDGIALTATEAAALEPLLKKQE